MSKITPLLQREPVALAALFRAILLLAVSFGFDLSGEQIAAIMLVAELALGVDTRRKVTPTAAA